MEKCRPHPLLTHAERPYLGHCESTTQQQDALQIRWYCFNVDPDPILTNCRSGSTKFELIRVANP
jgi:hypothetical protein